MEDIKKDKAEAVNSHPCRYCGEPNHSTEPDLLCRECREMFGHSFFNEL
jgi:hypothetical protein